MGHEINNAFTEDVYKFTGKVRRFLRLRITQVLAEHESVVIL